jgi:hypothetical protein
VAIGSLIQDEDWAQYKEKVIEKAAKTQESLKSDLEDLQSGLNEIKEALLSLEKLNEKNEKDH